MMQPSFYDSKEEYEMADKRGRNWKAKYLTIEVFETFRDYHFKHLKDEVREVKWLLRAIAAGVILWAVVDRLSS